MIKIDKKEYKKKEEEFHDVETSDNDNEEDNYNEEDNDNEEDLFENYVTPVSKLNKHKRLI